MNATWCRRVSSLLIVGQDPPSLSNSIDGQLFLLEYSDTARSGVRIDLIKVMSTRYCSP
jgi:hypothetical protein